MSPPVPQSLRTNRRFFVIFALAVVLLLAVNPLALLIHPDRSASAAGAHTDAPQTTKTQCPDSCSLSGGLSLASLFPFASDRETPERTSRETIGIADDRAGPLLDVLSSAVARDILQQLIEEPRTPSELAEGIDTSLQNVHYHVENLQQAGAIEEIATEYSSRGREMSVYTATCRPQMLVYDLE